MKMKKIIIGMLVLVVLGIANSTYAYTLVNGERVFGYVSGVKPEPGPEQAYVEEAVTKNDNTIYLYGNLEIWHVMYRILEADRDLFRQMVDRAGIRY